MPYFRAVLSMAIRDENCRNVGSASIRLAWLKRLTGIQAEVSNATTTSYIDSNETSKRAQITSWRENNWLQNILASAQNRVARLAEEMCRVIDFDPRRRTHGIGCAIQEWRW
jgi:hypothetical protein